jgi:hypothetical protein
MKGLFGLWPYIATPSVASPKLRQQSWWRNLIATPICGCATKLVARKSDATGVAAPSLCKSCGSQTLCYEANNSHDGHGSHSFGVADVAVNQTGASDLWQPCLSGGEQWRATKHPLSPQPSPSDGTTSSPKPETLGQGEELAATACGPLAVQLISSVAVPAI